MVGEVWGGTGAGGAQAVRPATGMGRRGCLDRTCDVGVYSFCVRHHETRGGGLIWQTEFGRPTSVTYPLCGCNRRSPCCRNEGTAKDTHSQHGARGARDDGIRCRAGAGRRDGRHVQLHLLLQQQVLPARTWNLLVPRFVPGCDIAKPNANQVRYRPARDAPIGRESQRDRRRLGRSHVRHSPAVTIPLL